MAYTTVNAMLWTAQQEVEGAKNAISFAIKLDAQKRQILERVAKRLIGPLKEMLLQSYARSGLQERGDFEATDDDYPGALYEAVQNCEVVVTENGLKAQFKSELAKKVYERGGALNYGAVRGAATRRTKVKLKAAHAPGKLGGGYVVIAARHFFELDEAQVAQLMALYAQFYQEEIEHARTGS